MTARLSKADRLQIEGEIRAVLDDLIRGCESLDLDLAFGMFSDSPDFLMMATDGTLCDHDAYVGNNVDYLKTCTAFSLETSDVRVRVLEADSAVLAWSYAARATLSTGETDVIDKAGASFVLRRVDDRWTVVYYHESSNPPVRLPN
jgi:hypothetical protein